MPRPRSLTHTGIAAAGLTVVDRDGLDSLTMRAVARLLGVGTMSLYRYVETREQLEGLIVDLILSAVDTEVAAEAPWTERVTVLVERARDAASAHPAAMPLLLMHRHRSEASMRWGEALLGVLADAGFAGTRRVIAFRGLLSYLFGALQVEHLGPLAGEGTAALAELVPADYPLLVETAGDGRKVGAAEEFRQGLALVLRGLDAQGPA